MQRQRTMAVAVGLMCLLLVACTAKPPLDPTNPTNGVYVTRMALTQTYNALTTGLVTGTVSKAQAQSMAPKLQQTEAALTVAEVASSAGEQGDYIAKAKAALDEVRKQLNLPPVGS